MSDAPSLSLKIGPAHKSTAARRRALCEITYTLRRRIRDELAEQVCWKCVYCGCGVYPRAHRKKGGDLATIDHRLPLSRGGTWDRSNLCIACRDCNGAKGNLTAEEFMAAQVSP